MNSKKKIWSILGVLLLLSLLEVVLAGDIFAAPKRLKIGVILPISGPISTVGMSLGRGFELCFDKVNEQGGVKIGKEQYLFDFILEDEKMSPEAAAIAAKKLVHKDGAKFVFGAILDASTEAIYQVCAPSKVLHLVFWVNVPWHPADVNPKKPLAVRLAVSPHDPQASDYDYLIKTYPNVKKVVISAPDIGYEGMIEKCKALAKKLGMEVIAAEKWPIGTTDFIPVFTKILAHKPDAIHAMISGQAMYQLRAARQLGFKGPFFSDSPLGPDVILRVAGPEASTDVFCNGMDLGKATDAMRDVMKRWQAKYKEEFVSDAFLGWDEAWILTQAMEKAKSVDPGKVLAALDTMTKPGSLQTVFGPGHMGGLKSFGVNRVLVRPIPISRIMNGKIEFVKFIVPEVP